MNNSWGFVYIYILVPFVLLREAKDKECFRYLVITKPHSKWENLLTIRVYGYDESAI